MTFRGISLGFSLLSLSVAQTKAPPPPIAETYESSIEGTVVFPASGSRLPIASVKAVRIKPAYWTSPTVTSSLRGEFRLSELPAGEYVLCAGSSNPQFADSCFWFDGRPNLSLAARQKLVGQKVALPAGRALEIRLRDPARDLTGKDGSGLARSLLFELQGPAGTMPRALRSHRPEPDGQSYRLVVPAAQPGTIRASASGLRIADEAGRELPSVGFGKALAIPSGATPIQLEFRILGPTAVTPAPGKL